MGCECNGKMTDHFLSDYHTQICRLCGIEIKLSIIPQFEYGQQSPLCVGYSRVARFRTILDQLFSPLLHGSPNHRVLAALNKQPKKKLTDGHDLLQFMNILQIPDKRYQLAHYYFAWYDRDYVVPPRPHANVLGDMERLFFRLECNYNMNANYCHKSFFSYNWLLQRLLTIFKLFHYKQFVKQVKCSKRQERYNTMFLELTHSDNDVIIEDVSLANRKLLDEPRGDDRESRCSQRSYFVNLLAKMRRNTQVVAS